VPQHLLLLDGHRHAARIWQGPPQAAVS
jgi:hypothetical protein